MGQLRRRPGVPRVLHQALPRRQGLRQNRQVAADVDGNGTVDINDAAQILLMVWNGTQTNEFALVGASDITTAELVMIGDVNDSADYIDMIA